MTVEEIRERAALNRGCGLPIDAEMIEALADVYVLAKDFSVDQPMKMRAAIARVDAIKIP